MQEAAVANADPAAAARWWQRGPFSATVLAFVLTRAALIFAGLILGPLLVEYTPGRPEVADRLLGMWARWDAGIYISIAQDGYFLRPETPVTAFFPLYPLAMQVATLWSDSRPVLAFAGVMISNASLLGALAYIVALGRLDFDESVGRRAALYYLVFPTTLFLSGVHTEALFLLLSVASFYHARRGQLALGGALGFLAALTRPYGALLAVPLAIESIRRSRLPLAAALPLLGPIVFFGWLWLQVGSPLAWFEAQRWWNRQVSAPWEGFLDYLEGPVQLVSNSRGLVDLVSAVALIALTLVAIRRLPASYAALAGSMTLLLLMSSRFGSMPRFALGVFPVFFILALSGHERRVHWALVAGGLLLAMAAMARYSQWAWVA